MAHRMPGLARNIRTRAVRVVHVSAAAIRKASMDSIDRCTGPCRCKVELDGHCAKGWNSRTMAVGFV